MSDNEKHSSEFEERLKASVAAGDVAETARLVASDWAAASIAQQAKELLVNITQGKTLTAAQALGHALLVALSLANELAIAKATGNALKQRIAELEVRVGGLKQSSTAYRGVWREEDVPYREGELCTHKGGLWHCWSVTTDKPGISSAWQLMSKTNGRD